MKIHVEEKIEYIYYVQSTDWRKSSIHLLWEIKIYQIKTQIV